jgi:hypothetical protein
MSRFSGPHPNRSE